MELENYSTKKNNKLKNFRYWVGEKIFLFWSRRNTKNFLLPLCHKIHFPQRGAGSGLAPGDMLRALCTVVSQSCVWDHSLTLEIVLILLIFLQTEGLLLKSFQLSWSQSLSAFDQLTLDIKTPTNLSQQTLKGSDFSKITPEKHSAAFQSKIPKQAENWALLNAPTPCSLLHLVLPACILSVASLQEF